MKKTRDIHHFWLFPKQPRIYHFFIDFLSFVLSFSKETEENE